MKQHIIVRGTDATITSKKPTEDTAAVSSIETLREKLSRAVWRVTWEDADTSETVTLDINQLRATEHALLVNDIVPRLRAEFPTLTEKIDAYMEDTTSTDIPNADNKTEQRLRFWEAAQRYFSEETTSEAEAYAFMKYFMAGIVAGAVVDKRIDFELIHDFPMALLQYLWERATGQKATTPNSTGQKATTPNSTDAEHATGDASSNGDEKETDAPMKTPSPEDVFATETRVIEPDGTERRAAG